MSDIQAIRERHKAKWGGVVSLDDGLIAIQDRATLLSALTATEARAEAAEARLGELSEALKPFADLASYWRDKNVPSAMEAEIIFEDDEQFAPTILIGSFYDAQVIAARTLKGTPDGR